MQILVIYDADSKLIKRLVGPMPVAINAHVLDGEGYHIATTMEPDPKTVDQLQEEVNASIGGAA
jgi:hypothetical protein